MNYSTEKKTNFYSKMLISESEAVEVYIGQNSGRQLQRDIENAKSEVLIISPYIDETKLDDLIKLKNRNINVRLAFSSLRKEQKNNILQKLIQQNKYTDTVKQERVKKQAKLYNYLTTTSFVLGICALILSVFEISNSKIFVSCLLILIVFFALSQWFKKKKKQIEKTGIYTYDYSAKINFKYLSNYFNKDKFVHSKIYVIDRKVAYLGSLNFTNDGFSSNFETRIRITHEDKIKELVEFVNNIFKDDTNFGKHELSWLGRKVYNEDKY